jgi:hypothetical protein
MKLIFFLSWFMFIISCNQAADGNNKNSYDKPKDDNKLKKNMIVFEEHILAVGASYNLVVYLNPEYLQQITSYGHIVNIFSSDDDSITFNNNSCLLKKGKSDNSCAIEFKINNQAKDIKLSFTVDDIAQSKYAMLDTDSSAFSFTNTSYKDIYQAGDSKVYSTVLKSSGVFSPQIVSLYGYGVNIISPSSKQCEFNQIKNECPITFQVQETNAESFPDSFLGKLIAIPSSGDITQLPIPICSTTSYIKAMPNWIVVKEQNYPMPVQVYFCDATKSSGDNKMIYLNSPSTAYCRDMEPPRNKIGSQGVCFNNKLSTNQYRIGAFMYFQVRDIAGYETFSYGVKDGEVDDPNFKGQLTIDERVISVLKFLDAQSSVVGISSVVIPEDSIVRLDWELDRSGVTDQFYIETTIKIKINDEYFDVSKDPKYSKFSNIVAKYYSIPLSNKISINTNGIQTDKPVNLKLEFKYQNSDKEIVNNELTVFIIPKNIK